MVPKEFAKDNSLNSLLVEESVENANPEIWSEENQLVDFVPETSNLVFDASGQEGDSSVSRELEDSESDFEEKIK